MLIKLFCAALTLSSAAFAAHDSEIFTGTLRNNAREHRATLETATGDYVLDFRGSDLYHLAERYDRESVTVEGNVVRSASDFSVLFVDRITFRPFNANSVTYTARGGPVAREPVYTTYERPVIRVRPPVRERTIIRERPGRTIIRRYNR